MTEAWEGKHPRFNYNFSEDELEGIHGEYPYMPYQANFDVRTQEGHPQGRNANVDTSRVDKPRYDPAANLFAPTTFNQDAINKQQRMQLDAARSQYALDQEYDNEVQKLNSLGSSVAMMTGGQFRPVTPSRRGSGGSASTEQSLKDMQNNAFVKHLYKTLDAAGGNFTDDEIVKFLAATNANPAQIKILMGMKDVIDLDGIKQLQKINDNPGTPNFGGIEYKYVWDYTPKDAAEGWKEDRADLTQQRKFAEDKAKGELNEKKTALYQRIAELPVYSEDGMMRPQTLEQYNKLATALGLTTPEEYGILEQHFGHLLKPGDKKTATLIEDNKRVFKPMTDYELEQANKVRKREGKPLWVSGTGGNVADLNKSALANLTDRIIQAGTTPEGPPGTPLLYSNFGQAFDAVVKAVSADPSIIVEDWKKFEEEVRARYNKSYKDAEKSANMELLVNNGLADPAVSGPEAAWSDLMDYQKRYNITGSEAERMMKTWAESPYHQTYSGPGFLHDDWGGTSPPILTRQDYIKYKSEFPVEDWSKVKFPPGMAVDTDNIDNSQRLWHAKGNNRVRDETLNGGKGGWVMVPVDEWRLTDGYQTRVQDQFKADSKPIIAKWNLGTQDTALILDALTKSTGAMDGVVLKKVEKMLDPTGVVRQSDIEFWTSLSSYLGRFRKVVGDFVDPLRSVVLPDDLRIDLGRAIKLIHDRLSVNSLQELNFLNEAFLIEAEENKTWDGGRLNWNKVIVPSQWSKFQNYKTGTVDGLFKKLEEKHSGVVIVDSQNAVIEGAGPAKFGAGNPEDEED
jgi:hypothetical protein